MRQIETARVKNPSFNPNPGHRTNRSEDSSGARDLIRWFITIPIVWLLIFICSAISVIGAAYPLPTDLLSNNQADYSPWMYAVIHPLREGFLEDIKQDFSFLDQTLSIFNQPSYVNDPFIEQTESSVAISVEATTSSTPFSILTETPTATGTIETNPTYSPTPSLTEDDDASPTASLTPSVTNTPGDTPTPTPSLTPSPTPTSSHTPSPTPTLTRTPSLTPTPSRTPTPSNTPLPNPTQPINICSNYDYFHAHTPYVSDDLFGYIVHAMPISGPVTQVVVTGVTINQDAGNPTILTVNKLNWYHTGMGSHSVNVGQRSESVYVSTNLTFYACYPAGQCDHSYYGGFIEAEFDAPLDGEYDMQITVNFPEYGQTCTVSRGVTN
jgi:hypothetical protein